MEQFAGRDMSQLVYLGIVLAAVFIWYLVHNRLRLGRTLQYASLWGLIFIGAIAAVGLWDDVRTTILPAQSVDAQSGQIVLPRAPDGHYYLTSDLNGAPVRFVIDTGASELVLTQADAQKAGLNLNTLVYLGEANTANGRVRTAPVTLDTVAIGPVLDRNVPALVNEGQMHTSLMGMRYLQRFDSVEIRDGQMVLTR